MESSGAKSQRRVTRKHEKFHRIAGFTLIELMIAVAVVAILAAIAYPAYQDAVRKSRRGQAKADLVELAQRAERYHTISNSYAGFWNSSSVPDADKLSPRNGNGPYYALQRDAGADTAANTFVLTAAPVAGSGQERDTRCMTLTLNQAGAKNITGGTGNAAECW
ncbi:MAG: type IV pilin protein [Burkholderiales bacterium]